MALRKAQIQFTTTADVSGANQAAAAMGKVSTAANTSTASSRQLGQIAGQAGFQIQDFAVQVGAGTSALTAFSQQAPQLLGVFGPTGAIAGALVAVGAVAAKIFLTMAADAKEAGEAAEEMAQKMSDAFAKVGQKEGKEAISTIEHLTELTNILRDSEVTLAEARNKRAASERSFLKSQQDLTEAAIQYLDKTGQIINAEEAIAEARRQTEEAQKEAAIADIESGVQIERQRYENIRAQKRDVQDEVDQAQQRLNELQAEQQRLTQEFNRQQRYDEAKVEMGAQEKGFESAATQRAAAELRQIEEQITALIGFVESAPTKIQGLTAAAYEQGAVIDAAVENAKTQIDRIESEFQLKQKAATLTEATTGITQSVSEITTAIGQFQPITEVQTQAKEKILAAVRDGEISARDQLEINGNIQLLMSTLQSSQSGMVANLNAIIESQETLAEQMKSAESAIKSLQKSGVNLPNIKGGGGEDILQIDLEPIQTDAAAFSQSLELFKESTESLGRRIEETINGLSGALDGVSTDQISAKATQFSEVIRDLSESVDQIQVGGIADLANRARSAADEIVEVVGGFEPINQSQAQAKERIMQAVSDGQITAQEQLTISSNLQLLLSQLKTGQEGMTSSLRELINNQSMLTAKLQSANAEIGSLRSKINNLMIINR
jgi:chromosome segregation ATPase